ncbi:polysaccharide deacetylase family protein [Aquimarina gracilis]|uniref:Polysaccharide deacetylase family protein n=1 Tax=Aquimarina gracilis TaxID=874422 RepID=A0ABU5ZPX9_9FLAO|nr:polysaccharide deacetylase family protein [Aquimarina gracilis]MEB3344151.1 polysaccharide deacetylase family protein [Aquimarina gracilis]
MAKFIPYKTPKILKQFFNTYLWDIDVENQKRIYLTFDDGPIPEVTEFVLKELAQYNAKATFFCIGDNIQKHPNIFKKIVLHGHSIGNHTMHHLKAWKCDEDTYLENVHKCDSIIRQHHINNCATKLFRPPYGQISLSKFKLLEKQGYKIVLWDILSKDWDKKISEEDCLQNVIQHTEKGSIIVFHDSIKASKKLSYCLPKVLDYFTKKGFIFDKIEI